MLRRHVIPAHEPSSRPSGPDSPSSPDTPSSLDSRPPPSVLTATADITAAYAALQDHSLVDVGDLTAWLRAWSDLEAAIDGDGVRRGIATACAVDDHDALLAHRDHVERVAPHCDALRRRLARRLLDHPASAALDPARHENLLRIFAAERARPDVSAELAQDEQRLLAEVLRLRAAATATWDGAPRDLAVVESVLDDPDRARRESAWRAVADRHTVDRPARDALFDRLLAVRRDHAAAAGFADVRAHRFALLARDFTPDDCHELHAAIVAEVVPLADELLARRRRALGLATLRPWDLSAPQHPADRTHSSTDEPALIAGLTRALADVDRDLADQFASLAAHDLLDLLARPGKAPGAFQADLAPGQPFVFASAVGRREDLWTVLHEVGHALHALACADEPLVWNRRPPRAFAELAATAVELLAGAHLGAFYAPAAARAARREQLVQAVLFLAHAACVDAFEHWLYTDRAGATWPAARDLVWHDLHARHFPGVDWSGLETERAGQWQRQGHLFSAPFTLLDYALAQLGALQLLERHAASPASTLAELRRALALGGRAGPRELYAAAGLDLAFTRDHVARRMQHVRRALADLE